MKFLVRFKNKKVKESVSLLPLLEQKKLYNLIDDLEKNGPIQKGWKNYSPLGKNKFHCHLTYKWVACWEYIEEISLETGKSFTTIRIIEVYYAGSRENAPY
ncbi:hypothetical protein EHQ50_07325 [Leptospira meyeri]|nr:hypothetical protein EHQ50_07325 [Leptospira meyeri]